MGFFRCDKVPNLPNLGDKEMIIKACTQHIPDKQSIHDGQDLKRCSRDGFEFVRSFAERRKQDLGLIPIRAIIIVSTVLRLLLLLLLSVARGV